METRKRLLNDFAFYAKHAVKIRTKAGEIKPLVLNRVQERFLRDHIIPQIQTTGKIRSVILKGRQQGLSTVVSAFIYWWVSQHEGQKAIVIAHVKESTQTLFGMYQRAHENVPECEGARLLPRRAPSRKEGKKMRFRFCQAGRGVHLLV